MNKIKEYLSEVFCYDELKWYLIMGIVLIILISLGLLLRGYDSETNLERKVRSGEWELQCYFREDGWKTVDPKKVIGLNPNGVTWEFTNGFASNCEIYK